MNPATTFFRACRRRSVFTTPLPSTTNAATPSLTNTLQQSQRRHLTQSQPSRVQPVNDLTDSPASQPESNLPQSILSSRITNTVPSPSSKPKPQSPASSTSPTFIATVTRVSSMPKTVRVTRNMQIYDSFLHKHYTRPRHTLVHDPQEILVEGDIIRYGLMDEATATLRKERRNRQAGRRNVEDGAGVKWVVKQVVTPFGRNVEDRVPGGDAAATKVDETVSGGVEVGKKSGKRQKI